MLYNHWTSDTTSAQLSPQNRNMSEGQCTKGSWGPLRHYVANKWGGVTPALCFTPIGEQALSAGFSSQYSELLFENDIFSQLAEIFLVSAIIIILIYGVVYTTEKKVGQPILIGNCSWLGCLTLLFTIILMVNNPITDGALFYNTLFLDNFTLFMKILAVCSALFSILISLDYLRQESMNHFEYIILILLSTASMMFLISSADLISMYLAIELQSLCFYVLAAGSSRRNTGRNGGSLMGSEFSTEAGLKYFLLGAFSSGLLLFGCSLIYGFTGTTQFLDIAKLFTCDAIPNLSGGAYTLAPNFIDVSALSLQDTATYNFLACQLGMIFILVGFLFKLTAAPFHMWAPDVYEGAPTAITAFFAITPKVSILAVFIRLFLQSFYDFFISWQTILIFCSICSMVIGALAALSQNKVKRLLAYSSIGHIGFILLALCCGTIEGLQALLIYLLIYIAMTLNLFAIIMCPVRRENHSLQTVRYGRIKYITDLASLAKTNPVLALTMTVTLFSMAGIPPLAGFYSKAIVLFAAMSSIMYTGAIVGVVSSVISCFYYIRVIKIMYFQPATMVPLQAGKANMWCSIHNGQISFSGTAPALSKQNCYIMGGTLFFIILFMTYPAPFYLATHKMALALSF